MAAVSFALIAACSVDSKVGYTFGHGGASTSAGGATSSGGKSGSGGRANAGAGGSGQGGSTQGGNVSEAGESGADFGGTRATGGTTNSAGSGFGGAIAHAGELGVGGEGGSGPCTESSCDGGFACSAGVCQTTCTDDAGCRTGYFCAASECHVAAVEVAATNSHSCARLADGSVRCWGSNRDAELGTATTAPRSAQPVVVNGVSGALQIAAAGSHTCALLANGDVVCWGENSEGELGSTKLGSATKSAEPVRVELPSAAQAISGTCAALKTGALYCWGSNAYSALADATLGSYSAKPVAIADLSGVTAVSGTACAIASGSLYCWGNNGDGQCGSGTEPGVLSKPTLVNGVTAPSAVSSGSLHACAVVKSGGLACWGSNSYGELGTGPLADYRSFTPVAVTDITTPIVDLSVGAFHTCVVLEGGAAQCWGRGDSGQLGNGKTIDAPKPSPVTGLDDAIRISAGFIHSCAVRKNGSVWCWGDGLEGELGTLWTSSKVPVQVPGW